MFSTDHDGPSAPVQPDSSAQEPVGKTPWPENCFYVFTRGVFRIFGKLWFRLEAVGKENVPKEGPLLMVSNHASNLDPPLAVILLERQVHSLAKEELFRIPIFGKLIPRLFAHPVRRGGVDRKALRECLDIFKYGHVLLLFPEGTRTRDGQLQEAKAGGAMIVLQAGVPVLPVYIDGSFEALPRGCPFPRRRKIRVFYGKPFLPKEVVPEGARRDAYDVLARVMMERIAELREQALKLH